MYNVVDSYYAGKVSTQALAALGISFPVFLIIIAVSGGLGRGSSALIANAIGAGDKERQRRFISQAFSIGVLVSILLTIGGMFVTRPVFRMLGAQGEYLQLALAYMIPVFLGCAFFVMTNLCNAILVATGDSLTFGKVLVGGFFLNLVLDPWFLYGGWGLPAMGIAGIAWATVVIQCAGCALMLTVVRRRQLIDFGRWRDFLPDRKVYYEIAEQAVPASFNILQVVISFFLITYFLKSYGEAAVASFGVTTRIEQIVLLPTLGLSAAIMALVGQNNGAGFTDRIFDTMKVSIVAGLVINLTISALMFVFSRQMMGVFTDDPEVIDIGVNCLWVIMPIQWSYIMTSVHLAMLQAMKRPMYGFFESMLRKVILPVPLFALFVWQWQMPVEWIWYAVAVTNVFMTVVTVVWGQRVLGSISNDSC